MASGYPKRDEGEELECEACGSRHIVTDAVGHPVRCADCGAVVKDPFALA